MHQCWLLLLRCLVPMRIFDFIPKSKRLVGSWLCVVSLAYRKKKLLLVKAILIYFLHVKSVRPSLSAHQQRQQQIFLRCMNVSCRSNHFNHYDYIILWHFSFGLIKKRNKTQIRVGIMTRSPISLRNAPLTFCARTDTQKKTEDPTYFGITVDSSSYRRDLTIWNLAFVFTSFYEHLRLTDNFGHINSKS